MEIFKIGWRDLLKALFVAVVSAIIVGVYQLITSCGFACSASDWITVLQAGVAGGLSYLIKNFFSDAEGKLGGKI